MAHAAKLTIKAPTLSRLASGEIALTVERAVELALHFKVSPGWLLFGEGDRELAASARVAGRREALAEMAEFLRDRVSALATSPAPDAVQAAMDDLQQQESHPPASARPRKAARG